MTIEEKLEHFESLCYGDATERSNKMLADYTASLRSILEEHKRDARRQSDMQVDAEVEKIEHEINKQLSIEQINIKREYSQKQEELKNHADQRAEEPACPFHGFSRLSAVSGIGG